MNKTIIGLTLCLTMLFCCCRKEPLLEEKILSQLKETDYRTMPERILCVNANSQPLGRVICVDGIEYAFLPPEDDRIRYIMTDDGAFRTQEGFSTDTYVGNILAQKGTEILFERWDHAFVPCADGWRACISRTYDTIHFFDTVLYFYRIDPSLSQTVDLPAYMKDMAPSSDIDFPVENPVREKVFIVPLMRGE